MSTTWSSRAAGASPFHSRVRVASGDRARGMLFGLEGVACATAAGALRRRRPVPSTAQGWAPAGARRLGSYLENCIVAKVCSTSRYEGHAVDALAPGGEEGRGRLR